MKRQATEESDNKVLEALKCHPEGITRGDLAKELSMSSIAARGALVRLREAGKAKCEGITRNTRWFAV